MGNNRILIVDDTEDNLYFLRCLLQGRGHEVVSATNGAEALAGARQNPPALIISDILMPGMDGFALCREWKRDEQLKQIPFVFYTATYTDERDRKFALSLGAERFVVKPQDPEAFMEIIGETLQQVGAADAARTGTSRRPERPSAQDDAASLKQYNEVLVRKLESKMQQLERANRNLEQDIAARKKFEQALRAAKVRAEQATAAAEEAARAKEAFIASLSHELRTPLSPILAAVQLMQRSSDISEEMRRHLGIIHRNIQLEARLIDDMLDLTRIVKGTIELERKPIDVCAMIEGVVQVCKPDLQARRLHFSMDLRDPPHFVNGDLSRLQQVAWNLLQNSIKFTAEGGCVGISCYREDSKLIIEVADSGIGIAPQVLPRLFGAFERGDRHAAREFGGLGLGLAISKRLIDLHGGTISADSEGQGRGATFRVVLPRLESAAVRDIDANVPAAKAAPRRILLVEDHGDTALMMKLLLQESGYQVETAGDVRQALQALSAKQFDLLISDLGLPDRSGLELMKELRHGGSVLKGIALSGFGREEDIENCRDAGFAAHLTKPIDVDTLIQAIESLGT